MRAGRVPLAGEGVGRTRRVEQLVLVVDDDEGNRDVLSEILAYGGYRVHAVSRARDARMLVERERPALVILDGSPAAERSVAMSLAAQVPAIVVSAATYIEREANDVGARAWLKKPFAIDDLLSLVREHATAASLSGGREG